MNIKPYTSTQLVRLYRDAEGTVVHSEEVECETPQKQKQDDLVEYRVHPITGTVGVFSKSVAPKQQPKQEQGEPVGIINFRDGGNWYFLPLVPTSELPEGTKFYTTPQQRKPLEPTAPEDANINQRISFKAGWKAAEVAHGIKE